MSSKPAEFSRVCQGAADGKKPPDSDGFSGTSWERPNRPSKPLGVAPAAMIPAIAIPIAAAIPIVTTIPVDTAIPVATAIHAVFEFAVPPAAALGMAFHMGQDLEAALLA